MGLWRLECLGHRRTRCRSAVRWRDQESQKRSGKTKNKTWHPFCCLFSFWLRLVITEGDLRSSVIRRLAQMVIFVPARAALANWSTNWTNAWKRVHFYSKPISCSEFHRKASAWDIHFKRPKWTYGSCHAALPSLTQLSFTPPLFALAFFYSSFCEDCSILSQGLHKKTENWKRKTLSDFHNIVSKSLRTRNQICPWQYPLNFFHQNSERRTRPPSDDGGLRPNMSHHRRPSTWSRPSERDLLSEDPGDSMHDKHWQTVFFQKCHSSHWFHGIFSILL